MREMDVVGVRVEMPSNQPIVLLREVTGERYLPIWIGAVEATAIAFAQQGVTPPRPLRGPGRATCYATFATREDRETCPSRLATCAR